MCWWIDETPPLGAWDKDTAKSLRIVIDEKDIPKYYRGQTFDLDNYTVRKDVAGHNHDHFGIVVEIGIETEFLSVHREAYLIVEYL